MKADDLEPIMELGRGAYGVVEKMRHVPSGQIMAVKVELTLPKRFLSVVYPFIHLSYRSVLFVKAKQSSVGVKQRLLGGKSIPSKRVEDASLV